MIQIEDWEKTLASRHVQAFRNPGGLIARIQRVILFTVS